jgi:hypothetical protein
MRKYPQAEAAGVQKNAKAGNHGAIARSSGGGYGDFTMSPELGLVPPGDTRDFAAQLVFERRATEPKGVCARKSWLFWAVRAMTKQS